MLTTEQQFVVNYIEEFHYKNQRPPKVSQIPLNQDMYLGDLRNPSSELSKALERRGVYRVLDDTIQLESEKTRNKVATGFEISGRIGFGDMLSKEQLNVAQIISSMYDGKPAAEKLKELGISETKYRGWLQDPQFRQYMLTRAESLLEESLPEVHKAIATEAAHGNPAAAKLFYQLVGRLDYLREKSAQVTINNIASTETLNALVESVQRHVKDPAVLEAIAHEFDAIIAANTQVAQQAQATVAMRYNEPPVSTQVVRSSIEM